MEVYKTDGSGIGLAIFRQIIRLHAFWNEVVVAKNGLSDAYMIEDMPDSELMGVPFDATLGALPPAEFKRLIINFKQTYFVVE